jgi:hypothetical protein
MAKRVLKAKPTRVTTISPRVKKIDDEIPGVFLNPELESAYWAGKEDAKQGRVHVFENVEDLIRALNEP